MLYPPSGPSSGSYVPPPYGPPGGPPPYGSPQSRDAGLAIGSLVLGVLALSLSWVPLVNNLAAIVALVALGLSIAALVLARRGKHGGKGLAVAGLVTSVLAFVMVIFTQMVFANAIGEVGDSIAGSGAAPADDEQVAAPEFVPIGVPVRIGHYEVTVDSVALNGDATVAGASEYNEPPTGQYVVAQLTVTYVGAHEGTPAWELTSIFHGADARQYSDCGQTLPKDASDAPTLNTGGAATFQVCMDVPSAAIEGGQLSVEAVSMFDEQRVYFAIR